MQIIWRPAGKRIKSNSPQGYDDGFEHDGMSAERVALASDIRHPASGPNIPLPRYPVSRAVKFNAEPQWAQSFRRTTTKRAGVAAATQSRSLERVKSRALTTFPIKTGKPARPTALLSNLFFPGWPPVRYNRRSPQSCVTGRARRRRAPSFLG